MQIYIKIISSLNLDFYIWLLYKLISQLSLLFDIIIKVIRPLYSEPKVDNYKFNIYHLYQKKTEIIKSAHDLFFSLVTI